jgi:hypothetical protein
MSFAYDPEDGDDQVETEEEEREEEKDGRSDMVLSDEEMMRGVDLALQSQGELFVLR